MEFLEEIMSLLYDKINWNSNDAIDKWLIVILSISFILYLIMSYYFPEEKEAKKVFLGMTWIGIVFLLIEVMTKYIEIKNLQNKIETPINQQDTFETLVTIKKANNEDEQPLLFLFWLQPPARIWPDIKVLKNCNLGLMLNNKDSNLLNFAKQNYLDSLKKVPPIWKSHLQDEKYLRNLFQHQYNYFVQSYCKTADAVKVEVNSSKREKLLKSLALYHSQILFFKIQTSY
jgi:hypothetical protein